MGLMDELKKIIHPYDDEDYDYEDDFEEPAKESRSLFDDRKGSAGRSAGTSAAARIATTRW